MSWAARLDENSLYTQLLRLKSKLAVAAQRIYDDWTQDAGFGICDMIAEAFIPIVEKNANCATLVTHRSRHVYVVAYNHTEAYSVDIPYDNYETVDSSDWWAKKQGVHFTEASVLITPVTVSEFTRLPNLMKNYQAR